MGKYRRPNIKFSSALLNELVNDKKSCVKVKSLKHHLSLHPYHLTDVNNSLKEIINRGIARFDNKLGGILLGFKNIKLASDLGHMNYDSCYIHVDVTADFYIFKPKLGKELKAIVTENTKGHVSCLLYNAFNISLPRPKNADEWLGDNVKPGFEVLVKITEIRLSGHTLPYICGTLSTILTDYDEPSQNADEKPDNTEAEIAENKISEKKKKKSKKDKIDIKTEPENESEVAKTPKKLKKEKVEDESLDELHLDELINKVNGNFDKDVSTVMADNDYRTKRKRKSSTLNLDLSSEMAELSKLSKEIADEKPKKKKAKVSI